MITRIFLAEIILGIIDVILLFIVQVHNMINFVLTVEDDVAVRVERIAIQVQCQLLPCFV